MTSTPGAALPTRNLKQLRANTQDRLSFQAEVVVAGPVECVSPLEKKLEKGQSGATSVSTDINCLLQSTKKPILVAFLGQSTVYNGCPACQCAVFG